MNSKPPETDLLAVLNYAIDGIVTFDSKGKIAFLNDTAERILGYQREELLDKSVNLLFPHLENVEYEDIEEVFKADVSKITSREVVAKHRNGQTFSLELRIGKIELPDKKIMWGMFRDLTDEKNQEKMLHHMNIILDSVTIAQSLFIKEKTPENVSRIFQQFLFDILAVTQSTVGMIVRYEEITGELSPLAFSNERWNSYFPGLFLNTKGNFDPEFDFLRKQIPTTVHQRKLCIQGRFEDPSGLTDILAMPMIKKNRIIGLIIIANKHKGYDAEIHYLLLPVLQACIILLEGNDNELRRKKMEMQIADSLKKLELQNMELESARDEALRANHAKSAFLANMSHEIRTPLNGVMGMTELLMNTKLDDKQYRYASNIYNSSEMLLQIVNDILDLSKIEAGELRLEQIPFNLLQLVKETVSLLQVKARAKHIDLVVYYAPDLPEEYTGDPVRLRQILINLIGNAVKFTEKGFVKLSINRDIQGSVHFEILDTGIGINAETQKKLFHSFTQADVSTTRKYGGTGLGLSICKKLVEKMGGSIGVNSIEGNGSAFWFTLPLDALLSAPDQPQLPVSTALIIGGETESNKVCAEYLKEWNISSTRCDNLEEAIERMQSAKYQLILWDHTTCKGDRSRLREAVDRRGMGLLELVDDTVDVKDDDNLLDNIPLPLYPDRLREAIQKDRHAKD